MDLRQVGSWGASGVALSREEGCLVSRLAEFPGVPGGREAIAPNLCWAKQRGLAGVTNSRWRRNQDGRDRHGSATRSEWGRQAIYEILLDSRHAVRAGPAGALSRADYAPSQRFCTWPGLGQVRAGGYRASRVCLDTDA